MNFEFKSERKYSNPLYALAVLPFAHFRFPTCSCVSTHAILLSIEPCPFILATIGPVKCSLSFFFIVDVLPFVLSAIRPLKNTSAFHFVVLPVPSVNSLIAPVVNSHTFDVVVDEVSFVCAIVSPSKTASTVFFTIYVLP